MNSYVGTSGYSYKEWKGSFYPKDIVAADMLTYYAERFKTVEINNTFYRMPTEKVLVQWTEQVPESFTFALKASRRITHLKRLQNVEDEVTYLLQTVPALGDKLGPMLFQLPPNSKKDMDRLEAFLELLPKRLRAAMEFRNKSWYDEEVFQALRARNVALVTADADDGEDPGIVPTADWGYLRLRREEYGERSLKTWAGRLKHQEWSDVFVFFKHEDEGTGPELALRFADIVEGRTRRPEDRQTADTR